MLCYCYCLAFLCDIFRDVDGLDSAQSDTQHNSNSSGWRPDLSEETLQRRAPTRDSWGDGAWDRGGTRERQRGGRQGGGNNWGRERREGREGREGGQRWAPRDGPSASGSSPGSGRTLRDVLQGEALYGVNPVLGALQALRREAHTLYVQESARPVSLCNLVMLMYFRALVLGCASHRRRFMHGQHFPMGALPISCHRL